MMDHWNLLLLSLLVSIMAVSAANQRAANMDDNDFAEFEDEDDVTITTGTEASDEDEPSASPKVVMAPEAAAAAAASQDVDSMDDDDATVEQEDEEDFEHLNDEDEFEGFDRDRPSKPSKSQQPPDLTIAKVPIHLHTNWDSFYLEMLMLAGLASYLLNFLAGKSKNSKLAQAWLAAHREILEANFHIIGDDGTTPEVQSGVLMKEAENIYSLWCSGRTCCEGMLVTIKLLKRQDLVSSISHLFRPITDQIIIKVLMDDADMDTFVFCLANKRVASRLLKDHADLSSFCPEKKSAEKHHLASMFQIMSECGEVTSYILDEKMTQAINKYESMVEYLHFSDQFTGPRQPDDAPKATETKKVLIFCFNVAEKGRSTPRDMEAMTPLLKMVFHCVDKMKRFKLGKEAKMKAEKSRRKVLENAEKATHTQRNEAAQVRAEEKRRAEKEKIMAEDDPDKQRKLEEKNQKREAKKKQPKVKRMKIKAM